MPRCLLVARKEYLTDVSTGLTGWSKNLDPMGNPTGAGRHDRCRSTRPVSIFGLNCRADLVVKYVWRAFKILRTPSTRTCSLSSVIIRVSLNYLGSNFKIHIFVSLTLSKVSITPKTSSYKVLLQNFDV